MDLLKLSNVPVMIGPSLGIVTGAIIGSIIKPSKQSLAIMRNLAAGLVLAAVSTEITPQIADVETWKNRLAILAGIAIGLGMMIILRTIYSKHDGVSTETITSIAIDFYIDSLLIGIALASISGSASIITALALGTEMFILSMGTISTMHDANASIGSISLVTTIFVLSSISGLSSGIFLARWLKNTPIFYALLAFGVAALIWLITEDLLHKSKYLDTRLGATALFVGFSIVLIFGWIGHQH